jgi:formylglycine-generating enzyme required for sulfatase activity
MSSQPSSDPLAKRDVPATRSETQASFAQPTTDSLPTASGSGGLVLQRGARPLPEYELVRKLGAGGFGEVWHARGPGGLDVALKFIRLDARGSHLEVRALEVMKTIRHPNLVSLFGVWEKEGLLILAMELCERTLHDRLREALAQKLPSIPVKELLNYMRDAASGLDALHARQVQHRDVKPMNLLLLARGVKVSDFGLAKLLERSIASNTGAMTPAYAAPEFMKGQIAQHSDQYSLAVSYFELRTGRLLFEGSIQQIMYGHLEREPDLSRLVAEERAVMARALAKEPDKRWPSCKAFVNALIKAHQGRKPEPPKPLPPPKPDDAIFRNTTVPVPPPAPQKTGWLWPVLAGLFLVLLVSCAVGALSLGWTGLFSGTPTTRSPDKTDKDMDASRDKDKGGTESPKPGPEEMKFPPSLVVDLGGGVDMEFVLLNVKGNAEFLMGSPPDEKERNPEQKDFDVEKQHKVTLTKPFYLAKYPVTQEQYEKLIGKNPSWFAASGAGKDKVKGMDTSRFPVEEVSWDDAAAFCEKMMEKHGGQAPAPLRQQKYRFALPTEAQWEYACRAGTTTKYYFGDDPKDLGEYAWYDGNSESRMHRVGEKNKPNAWGLHDMHGNVLQWCQDYYGPYDLPATDPRRSVKYSEDRRVLRGGCWGDKSRFCRAACRYSLAPSLRTNAFGFRVAFRLD